MNAIGFKQKIAVAALTECVTQGSFGLFKVIYLGTGHKCEPNHVTHLKETLSEVTRAMRICQHSVPEVNRAFTAFLRLFEIQDTLSHISQLNGKTLVRYSDLPKSLLSELSAKVFVDSSLALTLTALEQGLSVLASHMVDVEHDGHDLHVNVLFLASEIAITSNFCVVEHLTPLKFNVSGTCFTGAVRQTNLALKTCPNLKQVVPVDSLDRCFSTEVGFLCPTSVLKTITNFLGWVLPGTLNLNYHSRRIICLLQTVIIWIHYYTLGEDHFFLSHLALLPQALVRLMSHRWQRTIFPVISASLE